MHTLTQLLYKSPLFVSALLGGVIFTSCASAPLNYSGSSLPPSSADRIANEAAPVAELASSVLQNAKVAPVPRSRPQLIKKAAMTMIVNSVDKSVDAVSQIITKQQGDLIGLKEQQPRNDNSRHTALIQLRVPQNQLELTLEELAKLGTVENRNITAEDVGDRLVDFQARLTNLRKTEANLQKIMDRAGSVKDVLSVAQQLSNVRESIEQIDAPIEKLTKSSCILHYHT